MIRIALYENERDNSPQRVELEWGDLAEILCEFSFTPCLPCSGKDCKAKFGRAWSPVEIEGTRKNGNVRAVTVAVFDLDHLTGAQVTTIAEKLEGYAHAAHSTHSHLHKPEDNCLRLAMPLTRPIQPGEWPRFRAVACSLFSLPADESTKDLSRLFFFPSCPEGSQPLATTGEGKPLDVDAILAQSPPVKGPVKAPTVTVVTSAPSDEPVTDLSAMRARLKTIRKPETRALIDLVLDGEPIAQEGGRDNALNQVCSAIAGKLRSDTPIEAIIELLRPSLEVMPGDEGVDHWIAEAEDMLGRAQERRAEFEEKQRETLEANRRQQAAFTGALFVKKDESAALAIAPEPREPAPEDTGAPYTEEQVAEWASEQGCSSLSEFENRWVITHGDSNFVFVDGDYKSALRTMNLEGSLARDLARAPVDLIRETADGISRPARLSEILVKHRTVARNLEATLKQRKSTYDPKTQTFWEAVCPLREIEAIERPEIHEWIRLIGGDESEKLLDWVATITRLDRQTCAIYFSGAPGTGKTLLATGLSRLWSTGGPSELAYVLQKHNDVLMSCPLILGDETLPKQPGITAEIRRIIGNPSRKVERKFMSPATLHGCVRLILAGNNDRLLDTGEELSSDDLEAVAGRFLYIKPDPSAREYLLKIGGPPQLNPYWIDGDQIAQHALWLARTRKVPEGSRMLVEGRSGRFHARLATASGWTSFVCEWLVRYLSDPKAGLGSAAKDLLIGEGELWVSTEALAGETKWKARVPSQKVPSAAQISRALANLSAHSERLRVGEQQKRYHRVKAPLILQWAEENQVGDPEGIQAKLAGPNETIKTAKANRR